MSAPFLVLSASSSGEDQLIGVRHQAAKRQVLEFAPHALHAHPAGERRIDVERVLGDPGALRLRHILQGAHVVQPVGELDQQHAGVIGDRQQKLAEVFGLLRMPGDEVELAELGQSVDQPADLLAERLVDVFARDLGVLDRVVQHRRDDGGVVELEVGQNGRDFERVGKIRIARGALLHSVRLHRKDVGAVQELFIGVWIVAADTFHQFILPHHRRSVPTRLQRRIPSPCPRGASMMDSTGLQGREMANARAGRGLPHAFRAGSPTIIGRLRPVRKCKMAEGFRRDERSDLDRTGAPIGWPAPNR